MSNKWVAFQPLIGGMMIGAQQAFGEPPVAVVSYDGFLFNDRHYLKWLWQNHPDIPYFVLDKSGMLKDILVSDESNNPTSMLNISGNHIDLNTMDYAMRESFRDTKYVVSVPICAGLTSLSVTANEDSDKNNNMLDIAKWSVENIKPEVFVGENAAEFSKSRGNKIRSRLDDMAKTNGYSLSYALTSTYYCGLPQHRIRSFFWIAKGGKPIIPNDPPVADGYEPLTSFFKTNVNRIDDPMHNVEDMYNMVKMSQPAVGYVMEKFPDTWREWGRRNSITTNILASDLADDFLKWVETNCTHMHKKLTVLKERTRTKRVWETGVLCFDDFVNAMHGRSISQYMHPHEARLLTNRELVKLMGMPDDMVALPSKDCSSDVLRCVFCQNVPVNTAKWACTSMLNYNDVKYRDQNSMVHFTDFLKKFGRPAPRNESWLMDKHPEISNNLKVANGP